MRNGTRPFEAMEPRISNLPLIAIASVGRVKNVVNDLKRETNAIAKSGNVLQLLVRRRRQIRADPNGNADQRTSFRSMDSFQLFWRYGRTLESQVQDLTGHHARRSSRSMAQRRDRLEQTVGGKSFTLCHYLERECQKCIAGEDRHRLTELFMARGPSTTEVIVVHRGQVIVDQRIRMNHLDRRHDWNDRLPVFVPDRICGDTKTRPYALASSQRAVAHGFVNSRRICRFGGDQTIE